MTKNFKSIAVPLLTISLSLSAFSCNSDAQSSVHSNDSSSDDVEVVSSDTTDSDQSVLDSAEVNHLVFMREEEKLARDVYMTVSGMWPDATIFVNIGEGSEQTHADVMRDKLEDFGIEDPNPATNDLPSSIGYFTGEEYGSYFSENYQALINKASQSELDALYVGAFIEELDMHDIVDCPDTIVERDNGITECGLNYTDEPALINAYSSLLDGSKNHLRAFVGRIESIIGEGNYVAQVISQEDVDEILGR